MRAVFVGTRVVVAGAIVAAVVAQLTSSISSANDRGDGTDVTGTVIVNFLSYFTIDSTSLAAIVLAIGAVLLATGRIPEPRWFAIARLSVVTYMVITGVVYNLLLRGLLTQGATVPWSNEILHTIAPAYLLLDWLFAPGRNRMGAADIRFVIPFPLAWAIYTLVRGPFARDPYTDTDYWYPYPFFNPVTASLGYGTVAIYVVLIAVMICAVAALLLWVSRRWERAPHPAAPTP